MPKIREMDRTIYRNDNRNRDIKKFESSKLKQNCMKNIDLVRRLP